MRINITSGNPRYTAITEAPYLVVAEAQLTIGAALLPLWVAANGFDYVLHVCNRSAGGQTIRVGAVPSYGPAAGILLAVNDYRIFEHLNGFFPWQGIASGAGALLDICILGRLITR